MEIERNARPGNINSILRNKPRERGGSDYSPMKLPGQDMLDLITPGNTPLKAGVYLIFFRYDPPSAWSNTEKGAGKATARFENGQWEDVRTLACSIANYTDNTWANGNKILGYMGPLPTLNLKCMTTFTPGVPVNQTFFISTLKQAAIGNCSSGPHPEYMLPFLKNGFDGEYIFIYDSEDEKPTPIAAFDSDSSAAVQWQKLDEDEIKSAQELMTQMAK